jgi:hypothetical protein
MRTADFNSEDQKPDPENEQDFGVAYKKLVKKLNAESGGNMLVPESDLFKLHNSVPLNMEEVSEKIQSFQDKKRQKIQFMKELQAQKELEECNFAPTIATRKKGDQPERRNID